MGAVPLPDRWGWLAHCAVYLHQHVESTPKLLHVDEIVGHRFGMGAFLINHRVRSLELQGQLAALSGKYADLCQGADGEA